ncbi:MAG: exodeoxyribonuclease V subunit gamma, partial [Rubrivivax sp.]
MLHIHFSNRLEALREQLLQRLGASDAGVFAAEQVIVPSAALRRALSLAIADAQGVCANVHFAFLAQWLWQQIARLVPGVAEDSPFAKDQLVWRVHGAFGDAGFVARHPRLAAYLGHADEVMRYELAGHVAALLEQYVTWRPEWLHAWRQGRPAAMGDGERRDEPWQAALWQRIDAELGMHARHPAQALVDALQRGGTGLARRAGLPQRAHVFALPGMPPLHMRLLQQLGNWVELHLYVLNPCREYWFELVDRRRLSYLAARGRAMGHEEGNRLLAAWGKQTQGYVESLIELCGEGTDDDACFVPAAGTSLLERVQDSMLDLHELAPGSVALADGDRSVELHVCHSLTRELEVLQDHLLGLFATRPGLQPGEILVVTPDLDAAAPLIDALFGTAPKERLMPYAISGRPRSGINLPARALLALLSLAASRCLASEL